MTSKESEKTKARLPKDVVVCAQKTLDMLPYLDQMEESLYWSTVALAYSTGKADEVEQNYRQLLTSRTEKGR